MNRRDFLYSAIGISFVALMPFSNAFANHGVINKVKKTNEEWKKSLTAEQYNVLREEGTEPSGSSPLNKEKRKGVFACAGCGLELFKSENKYESGTGWPSFFDAIDGHVETKRDFKLVWPRTEYHCARCGGHQGHIFKDGPKPTGLRYCNNGVALKFIPAEQVKKSNYKTAVFAGGCFWCIEADFEKLDGVIDAKSGYTGGSATTATYKQVSKGGTEHFEAVEVTYDPTKIKYEDLLEYFWRHVDPLDASGQFCDKGSQYRSAVFYKGDKQKELIENSKENISKILKYKVATVITEETDFYPAEKYHQAYYKKNPIRYRYYRNGCGRDNRVKDLWGSHF